MQAVATIPLERVVPLGGASITPDSDSIALLSDTRQWAYSAEAEFDIPGIGESSRVVKVCLEVKSGILGIGWLCGGDGSWVVRSSAVEGAATKHLSLVLPVHAPTGKLVFDNWTQGGKAAHGIIRSIQVVPNEAEEHFRVALAQEQKGNLSAAIVEYKAVLARDPSHLKARVNLGRLQFAAPNQPFLDEVRKRAPVDVCAVVIQVRNPCNYRCHYCVAKGHNNEPVERFDLGQIEKAYARIQGKVVGTQFDCGGGEPTVHPQFPELLKICAQHGAVDLVSNNSQNPERWLPREAAGRIFVRSALHPEGEPKIDRYIEYARYLIGAGCKFRAIYIAHPERVEKIPHYRELFLKHGIPFNPVSFIGKHLGKSYPHAHTAEEKRIIGLDEEERYWYHRIEPHTGRIRNFRGIPCIAGQRYIYITKNGEFRRCIYDTARALEAPLAEPEPCGVDRCGCGMWLEQLNAIQTPQTYNFYGSMIGVETVPVDWMEPFAKTLGYEGAETAMTLENINMYDALMAAYAKDEIPE